MNTSTSSSVRSDAGVFVRSARGSDTGCVIDLLKQSHAAARWAFSFDPTRAHALFATHMQAARACVLVMEYRGAVAGLLMATAFDHPFGAGLCAKETVWFVSPAARGRGALRMLEAYEAWAVEQGCAVVGMASLALNDVSKIYQRQGYAPVETHFMKSLVSS